MPPKEIVWLTGLAPGGCRRLTNDQIGGTGVTGFNQQRQQPGNRRSFIGGQLVRPRLAALNQGHPHGRAVPQRSLLSGGAAGPCLLAMSMIDFANWLVSLRRLGWRFIV